MAGYKLVKIMQDAARQPSGETTDMLFGVVISLAPLQIDIGNGVVIDEKFLLLSALCKEKTIPMPAVTDPAHTHLIAAFTTENGRVGQTDEHNHSVTQKTTNLATTNISIPDVTLWRGLIVGDKVRMLRVSKGQLFYVLEREEF